MRQWPAGMMPKIEFINAAARSFKGAGELRAAGRRVAAAHEELNAYLCQLAPAIISIAESLATLAEIAEERYPLFGKVQR